jgi:hypothetical protein
MRIRNTGFMWIRTYGNNGKKGGVEDPWKSHEGPFSVQDVTNPNISTRGHNGRRHLGEWVRRNEGHDDEKG